MQITRRFGIISLVMSTARHRSLRGTNGEDELFDRWCSREQSNHSSGEPKSNVSFGSVAVIVAESRQVAAYGHKRSFRYELLDTLANDIDHVNGAILADGNIVAHLELSVMVSKATKYSLNNTSCRQLDHS